MASDNATPTITTGPIVEPRVRPTLLAYNVANFRSFPSRVFSIPPAGSVKVRRFGLISPLNVRLDDVLEGRHLPPLSPLDFEDYLRYREHSVENLYFKQWLDDYQTKYAAAFSQEKPDLLQLSLSYVRARRTFFYVNSPLALNLSPGNIPDFTTSSSQLPSCADPSIFAAARNEVNGHLRRSLSEYIQTQALGNAGRIHLLCGLALATSIILTGVIPILVQIYHGEYAGPKSVRLACIPFFWIGFFGFLSAANGLCPVFWAFGEGRQLKGYELVRPSISAPVAHTTISPKEDPRSGLTEDKLKDHLSMMELGYPIDQFGDLASQHASAHPPPESSTGISSSVPIVQVNTETTDSTIRITTAADVDTRRESDQPEPYTLDFDAPPSASDPDPSLIPELIQGGTARSRHRRRRRAECRTLTQTIVDQFSLILGPRDEDQLGRDERAIPRPGNFGPMTKIEDPAVIRSNWEVIAVALVLATLIAAALTGGLYKIPTVRH